ncbi:MAG: hypothetical protein AAF525_00890 [Pseudomonadota bacterium]
MTEAISKIPADDDRVFATRWKIPPGSETGYHVHERDYIVVYLSDGVLTVVSEAGDKIQAEVSKHDLTSRRAGV